MRIVSLLPSATEIVFALGLGDDLIATGPDAGHALLAELCGYVLIEDELVPVGQ